MSSKVSLRSVHGKYLSAQPDGRAEWNRDIASTWEIFHLEERQGGKIALRGAHGMYVSSQSDGSVQINRREAPPGGWEEFTAEIRPNAVCLKSCHGKYLSAQQDGTAQWNRDHAPRGGWEEFQIEHTGGTGQREPATITAMHSYVIVAQAGSPEVNGNYEFMPGKHENRHFSTIAGHYQHTQNPEIFIAFQDCGTNHQRPEWNKWMIISKVGVLYAAHTGGKIGVPPREGVWENVEGWGHPGAPGGKHPAPTAYHPPNATTQTQQQLNTDRSSTFASGESIQVLEAVSGNPVRFKINNPPNHNDAWVGIYPKGSPDQDHGEQNQRWKYIRDIDVNNVSLSNGGRTEGDWSIRVFSDSGYTLAERKDFTIHSEHKIHSTESISVEERFEFVPVSEYDEVWNDSGSGAEQDVSVWRPRVPAGCHLIGMTAKNGHSRPTFSTLVIRAGGRDIAPPERFDLVWWQERGKRRFWCWRPIPPAGYVSLGDVGTTSETPPSHNDVVCVALACLSPNRQPLGGQIWNDRGGGAPKDAAFFAQPGGTGLFRCSDDATHNKPHGEFPIPAGASTNGIEILEAVVGKPVRFRINNRPSSNNAWVGIYPMGASDQEHGEQNKRWKWLRDIDMNNASFPEQSEGDWSIRLFSDGGHTLQESKDFTVKPKHVVKNRLTEESNNFNTKITFAFGLFLLIIGLPLLIFGQGGLRGVENLGMIIPGAILTGIGAFLTVGASFVGISSMSKAGVHRWKLIVTAVFAVMVLIPGIIFLIIGIGSAESYEVQSESVATLEIIDIDDKGDQGFIIFLEGIPGDYNNNGVHDYCENLIVNATHTGGWMSEPWTESAMWNQADETRQVFELEIAHYDSGCSTEFWPEQKFTTENTYQGHQVSLVKIGWACYGCMKGTTTISAEYSDDSKTAIMWIQDGEKVTGATLRIFAGSFMIGIGLLTLMGLVTIYTTTKSATKSINSTKSSIEIVEAIEGEPIQFRINNPPIGDSAWVGIYPLNSDDKDHGEEGEQWNWLSKINTNDVKFYEISAGHWSIRVFSDGGFTLDSRLDFEVLGKKERWWID